jgi:hypothetical protein
MVEGKAGYGFKDGVSSPKIPEIGFKMIVSRLYMEELASCRKGCEERIREIREQSELQN